MDTKFFDNQSIPILIINQKREILYSNTAFKQVFGIVKKIERFSNRFFFEVCVLNSEIIESHNPIFCALNSKEPFFTQARYQISKNESLSFDISSYISDEKYIITYTNTTAQNRYNNLLQTFNDLKDDYAELLSENQKYSQIQQKAQSQAIKMALLNRFTNLIRESVNIDKITTAALKELCTLFGGFKSYYASENESGYTIQQIWPQKYNNEIRKNISYDETINDAIAARSHNISHCLKEYNESTEPFKTRVDRMIIPIYHHSKLLGILVVLSYSKINFTHEEDVLKSISMQIANALVQASLFEQINKQNIQLEDTLKELKETQLHLINSEKMASLGQLVAGVAHEINTPLASINSNNSILEKLLKRLPQTEETSAILETLREVNNIDKEAIKRISKIVVSLKQFVRLDEAELQLANINKELDLTLDLIRHETKNKIEIIRNYGEIEPINCYPNMLNQVFMNILINACQSIENKGQITITTTQKADNLEIRIKDTGCGISETDKEKVFLAGYTTKGVGVGTGLGLAITKKIIEKHNGTITFESENGNGTEFIINIPY